MSDFIRVLGDDPVYTGRKTYMWIDSRIICKVYPIYAENGSDGNFWICTHEHDKAVLITYTLVDVSGTEYSCGKEKELLKLGIVTSQPSPMGFVWSKETGTESQFDPIIEHQD